MEILKILVVDDDPGARHALAFLLGGLFATSHISEAVNGTEALTMNREHGPEIIFMDAQLPGKSGADTVKALRTIGCRAKIVMVTAKKENIDNALADNVGIDAGLEKPCDEADLVAVLNRLGFPC